VTPFTLERIASYPDSSPTSITSVQGLGLGGGLGLGPDLHHIPSILVFIRLANTVLLCPFSVPFSVTVAFRILFVFLD